MNKIVLVTTKGCEGCNIMHKSIKQALDNTSKKIEFVIKEAEKEGSYRFSRDTHSGSFWFCCVLRGFQYKKED